METRSRVFTGLATAYAATEEFEDCASDTEVGPEGDEYAQSSSDSEEDIISNEEEEEGEEAAYVQRTHSKNMFFMRKCSLNM